MGAFLAVLAAGAFGTADFLGGLAARRGTPLVAAVISQIAGFAVLVPVVLLQPAPADHASMVWGTLAGASGGLGLVLLFRALAAGAMALTAPVVAVVAAGVPVLAGLAAGERPNLQAWAGVVVGLVAVAAISRPAAGSGRLAWQPVGLALASGTSIGLFLVCLSRASPAAGMWPLVAARTGSLALLSLAVLATRSGWRVEPAGLRLAVVSGLLDMTANALFLLALRRSFLVLVAVLVSLYPAATVGLAVGLLRERLERSQLAGVGLALAAIGLIAGS